MEDKLMNRRSRPRPYDLRRKVLMKNFFKEQMTYIPQVQFPSSIIGSNEEFSTDSSDTSDLHDLSDVNDENSSTSNESFSDSSSRTENSESNARDPISMISGNAQTSIGGTDDSVPSSSTSANSSIFSNSEPKLFKLTNVLDMRRDRKKKKVSGITKAKLVHKADKISKPRSLRSGLKRLLSSRSRPSSEKSSDNATKSSSKSLISMFKSQKERRKARQAAQSSSADNGESERKCTSNQSVQTDANPAQEEMQKIEQSNKLLQEENRLLSESLSYFMSSNSLDSQLNSCNSPLQSSNRKMSNIRRYPGCYDNLSSCSSYGYGPRDWLPRSRVSRSKSLHGNLDRRNNFSHPYRTRSMNLHNYPRDFSFREANAASASVQQNSTDRIQRRNVLTNLPVSSSGRIIQRRSSMPERILSESERSRICRRTGSLRNGRTPFHSLPAEAFY